MSAQEVYQFGPFVVDVAERRLVRNGAAIALAPKAHDLLVSLVRRAGRLVTKQELLDEVWPETFVQEGILSVHISSLRKALGDRRTGQRHIETVSRAGYIHCGRDAQDPPARRVADAMAGRRPPGGAGGP